MKKRVIGIIIGILVILVVLFLAFGRETGSNYMEELRQLSQSGSIVFL